MKPIKSLYAAAALLGLPFIFDSVALARDVTETTTTTTTTGTISEFGPGTIVVRSETAPEPMRYSYSKTTTYTDETGAPVSIETVKSGLPVTVYYTRDGDRMVANRVIVRRGTIPEGGVVEARTSTTTLGTVSEFGPDTIVIRSQTSPDPIRYGYTKRTTYVDETGAPVSMETVRSGLPVTVYYSKDGDRMMATKVIVRRAPEAGAPGAVIERKTTTTTTKKKGDDDDDKKKKD